jgi:hypothetical protein
MQNIESLQRLFRAEWRELTDLCRQYKSLTQDSYSLANTLVNHVFEEQYVAYLD